MLRTFSSSSCPRDGLTPGPGQNGGRAGSKQPASLREKATRRGVGGGGGGGGGTTQACSPRHASPTISLAVVNLSTESVIYMSLACPNTVPWAWQQKGGTSQYLSPLSRSATVRPLLCDCTFCCMAGSTLEHRSVRTDGTLKQYWGHSTVHNDCSEDTAL